VSDREQFLLDTNVLSESRKKQADAHVTAFLSSVEPNSLYISVLTIGELRKGITLKERNDPISASLLRSWVEGLELSFSDRILGVDSLTAKLWGELSGQRPRAVIDTLIAATAMVHGLILVTRNVVDVSDLNLKVLNPWLEG